MPLKGYVMHPLAIYFLIFPLTAQADLFKCTDNAGKVTYTNSACAKVGLKESKVIPPPPPPALDKAAKAAGPVKSVVGQGNAAAKNKDTVAMKLVKPVQAGQDKCAKLNGDMGRIMDQMDTAQRNNHTPEEEAGWNEVLKKLQSEKNRLGCF
jgi:hypothetical protein